MNFYQDMYFDEFYGIYLLILKNTYFDGRNYKIRTLLGEINEFLPKYVL